MKTERRFVEFVPYDERKGRPSNQFPLWFSVNMMVLTASAGSLGVLSGLNMFWSVVAIICGNGIGAVFVALHSVQGPRLGVPQMIQSRAQFGVIGAIIPLMFVFVMYIGYYASNNVIGADAFTVGGHLPTWIGALVLTIIIFFINFYGHDLIHRMAKIFSFILAIGFIILSAVVFSHSFPTGTWSPNSFDLNAFMLLIAATATWQLTFAPYVADYSRYLPARTSGVRTFVYTYTGLIVATVWLMTLGSAIATFVPSFGNHPTSAIAHFFPSALIVPLAIFVILGVIATNIMNLYGAVMSTTTIVNTFMPIRSTPKVRAILFGSAGIVGGAITVFASQNLMAYFESLLDVLGYLLFPWTIINLTDFFLLRKGRYRVSEFGNLNGIYGKINLPAFIAYAVAIACEIPFMSIGSYDSYFYTLFGGIDFAWVVALLIPGFIYYPLMRNRVGGQGEISELDRERDLVS